MKFQAKTYKRLGAMAGSVVGILALIAAIGMGKNFIGAILLILFMCVGIAIGAACEKKYGAT